MITETQHNELLEQLKKQQETIDLLMQVAPKQAMLRLQQQGKKLGKSFLVWLYKEDIDAEPRLITRTKLINNDVMVDRENNKLHVKQIIELFFEPDKGKKGKINLLKATIDRMVDEDKKKEKEAELEKLLQPDSVKMPYLDFAVNEAGNRIVKERVMAKGTVETDDGVFLRFDWKGEEREISIAYIN